MMWSLPPSVNTEKENKKNHNPQHKHKERKH
jgi:hypothetical protein